MSAIVGIYNLDGRPVDHADLDHMVDHAAPWKADCSGVWHKGPVGLGHRMMFDTPESLQDHPPLVRGELALTADARIDNRREMIAALDLTGRPASEITDSELILHAYEKWGEDCPTHLIGDFAFAIWDNRLRKLFCSRDPMAVRPFYYYHDPKSFVFGSNIKSILQVKDVPRKLDELSLACYISKNFAENIRTFYQNIIRLAGGFSLCLENARLRIWEYWDPDLNHRIHLKSNDEYGEALREVFFEAVRCRMRSHMPVGSMLSGGLDSSSIVCAGRRILQEDGGRRPLHTFSAIFPEVSQIDRRIDERHYIHEVVSGNSLIHHDIHADEGTPMLDPLYHGEEPLPTPNGYLDLLVFEAAQKSGVRTLLSGVDGDSAISHGYELLVDLFWRFRWYQMFKEARALSAQTHCPTGRILKFFVLKNIAPAPVIWSWRLLHGRNHPRWLDGNLIRPDFARRVGLGEHIRKFTISRYPMVDFARHVHKSSIRSGFMMDMMGLLRKFADTNSLDLRYPFFDRRVLEFCLAIPPEQKLQNGLNRAVLRNGMREDLPPGLKARAGKGNLSTNFDTRYWHWERDNLRRIITERSQLIADYVDTGLLKASYDRFAPDPMQGRDESFDLFKIQVLVNWLERSGLTP